MKSVLILVLTMAFYASVKCEDSADFSNDLLTKHIKQLIKLKTVKYQQEQSDQKISTLQDQIQFQNANVEDLQHKVSLLSEASARNENRIEALRKEIEQLKSDQKPHQTTLNEVEQHEPEIEEPSPPKVESDLQWVSYSLNDPIPKHAVVAGYDVDKAPIYLGRTFINGSHIITKVIPARPAAYYSFEGLERSVRDCEILTGTGFSWMRTSNGYLPHNAVSSGKWINDVPHYIGRVNHYSENHMSKSLVPGTIQGVRGVLYIAFHEREHEYREYEVLVQNQAENIGTKDEETSEESIEEIEPDPESSEESIEEIKPIPDYD